MTGSPPARLRDRFGGFRLAYHWGRHVIGASGQSDEAAILDRLVSDLELPGHFVEFGFNPTEFNCARLARRFPGLLIDLDADTVRIARKVLPRAVTVQRAFLDLGNLDLPRNFLREHRDAVLSIDVDGNDYWFLEALIAERPAVISVEYNASFGTRPVSTAYDPRFCRHEAHPSGWLHGASITALAELCDGYDLVAVSANGVNAFFARADINTLPALDPVAAYRESAPRNKWSGITASEQWARLARDGALPIAVAELRAQAA